MSYRVVKDANGYNIYEKYSDVTIILDKEEKEARDMCRKLNLGSGFAGWTPGFIAVRHNVKFEEA
jgi:hypothetical protein